MPTIDLRPDGSTTTVNGVTFVADTPTGSGTGSYFTFLAIQDNSGVEEGFNTDTSGVLDADAAKTRSVLINTLELKTIGGVDYYILRMDMNEPGNANSADAPISLEEFKLYVSSSPATIANFSANQDGPGDGGLNLTKIYDLDSAGETTLLLRDRSSGSGSDDYEVRIPAASVTGGAYLTLYLKFSDAQAGFEEVRALTVPFVAAPSLNVTKTVTSITDGADFGGSGQADSAGDVIHYAITVQNTGNVPLTGVTVTDSVEGAAPVNATPVMAGGFNTGDTNADGQLSVGETWNYTAAYTLTQADLDGRGGGDDDIDNVATADSNETGPDTASASAPLVYAPALNVTKAVTSVTDGSDFGGSGQADSAGDVIHYAITVQNTGNIALTGITVTDAVEGGTATDAVAVMAGGFNTGDTNADGKLSVGETWNYTASYTLTQADLDGRGGGDGDIDNVATADSNETEPDTAAAAQPLVFAPSIDVEKEVSVDGGLTWHDADTATGPTASPYSDIQFRFTVTNTGNVALTDVAVTDSHLDLNGADLGEAWTIGSLAAGGTAEFVFGDDPSETVTFQAGQHANTATATGVFNGVTQTDTDLAHYLGREGEGLSHGYWKNHGADWDLSGAQTSSFESFFGVDLASWSLGAGKSATSVADISFAQALSLQGGGVYALAREAVAAVLNANDEDIDYIYTETQIIDFVKAAFSSGDYTTYKNLLETQNTAGDWMV